jgi:hypothetical protein
MPASLGRQVELLADFRGDGFRPRSDLDLEGVFGRLERLELACQERRAHEVAPAGCQAAGDQVLLPVK